MVGGDQHRWTDGVLDVVGRQVECAMVLSISGDLDMLTAPQLRPVIDRCLGQGECHRLVVDLAEVTFLGSSGLSALLEARDVAQARGLGFRLVAGDSRHIIRPLKITGLEKVLTLYRNVDEAVSGADDAGDVD